MPESSFILEAQESEKELGNPNWRAICNVTCGIDDRHGVITHCSVSDSNDGAHPLGSSHSALTAMLVGAGSPIAYRIRY
jgi:hypothetical protein